jgi:hypothetical protein
VSDGRKGAGEVVAPRASRGATLFAMKDSAGSALPTPTELLARARDAIDLAGRAGVPMRLLGGLGIFALSESARRPPLARAYGDFDVAVPAKKGPAASKTLEQAGFVPDRHFNALHGARRMIFRAPEGYPVDVLIGVFEMCHRLDIASGFDHHELTISPADLLLTKLQIVRIEPKDLGDAAALVLDLSPGKGVGAIDVGRFASPLADDWGFFHTVEINLGKLDQFAAGTLSQGHSSILGERVSTLREAMAKAPKSFRWKMRARVGERVSWYEIPDDLE